jgi:hypothetical protein
VEDASDSEDEDSIQNVWKKVCHLKLHSDKEQKLRNEQEILPEVSWRTEFYQAILGSGNYFRYRSSPRTFDNEQRNVVACFDDVPL